MFQTIQLGDVSVTRVMEWEGLFAPVTTLFPDSDEQFWREHCAHLAPDHWDPATAAMHACRQTFILRSEGRTGWNTYLHDREWVPTFPNATYLFSKADFEFWNPLNGHHRNGALINQNMFEDSVAPIARAGLANLRDGDTYRVDANLTLELAPGPAVAVPAVEALVEAPAAFPCHLRSPSLGRWSMPVRIRHGSCWSMTTKWCCMG